MQLTTPIYCLALVQDLLDLQPLACVVYIGN